MDMPLMALLQEEHRRIAAVCGVIDRSLAGVEAGDERAVALVRLALEYLRDYPEWNHHPREEYLFTMALEKDPLLERSIAVVLSEHDALPGDTQALLDFFDKPLDAHRNTRVVAALRLYVEEQHKHMVREDRDIFPRLHGLLPASAWTLPPANSRESSDPLAGKAPAGRFQPLCDAIASPLLARS